MSRLSGIDTTVIKHSRATVTFDGTSGKGLAGTAVTVFTVTGRIYIHALTAFCTTNLNQAQATAQISLGTTNQPTRFIGAMNSVDLDANAWWVTTTPAPGSIDLPDALQSVLVGENIIVNPTAQNTNDGIVVFDLFWEAITDNGAVS